MKRASSIDTKDRKALYRAAIERNDAEGALYQKMSRRLEIADALVGRLHGSHGTEENRQSRRAGDKRWKEALVTGEIERQLATEGFLISG